MSTLDSKYNQKRAVAQIKSLASHMVVLVESDSDEIPRVPRKKRYKNGAMAALKQ